ncbi:hypothetical protein WOLCODRAFT_137254 [Wolfiporia cocos MD-104 SS10]|uniref:Uncharacterized protein n=1 Tax=Wolfiporia cocos (strain MD-104) TaxID=742152 RepID=A0A2H3JWW4_WOLCO|nr:hypothetical protein WOLCODRAFT_137254 [Wolfiporia cocos MD-104 SS10]
MTGPPRWKNRTRTACTLRTALGVAARLPAPTTARARVRGCERARRARCGIAAAWVHRRRGDRQAHWPAVHEASRPAAGLSAGRARC